MGGDNSSIDSQQGLDSEQDKAKASHDLSANNTNSNEIQESSGQPQATNESLQQSSPNSGDQPDASLKRQETDENKLILNKAEDDYAAKVDATADESIHEDPHTSFLQPSASDKQQYTTPSKSLPPLKDQEPIVTPKLFDVAPDNDDHRALYNSTQEVASSPIRNDILSHTQDQDRLEGDTKAILSIFLSIDKDTLKAINDQHVIRALLTKAREFERLQSQNNQFRSKLEETFTNSRSTINSLQQRYSEADNSLLALRDENAELASKSKKQEVKVRELELSNQQMVVQVNEYQRLSSEKASELKELNEKQSYQEIKHMEKLEELSSANVAQSKKLNQITMEYNRSENEKFAISLQLTKAQNEANYLKDQKLWYEEQLKSAQSKYTDLLQKYETEQLQTDSKVNRLTVKSENLDQLVKRHEKTIADLEASLKSESSKKSATESKLRSVESRIIEESNANQDLLELTKLQSDQRAARIEQLEAYSEELKSRTDENISKLRSTISLQEQTIAELEEKLERMESALSEEFGDKKLLLDSDASTDVSRISLPTLFSEYNHVKKQLTVERIQREKLEKELESFVIELDARKPAIANYKDQIQFYESLVSELNDKIESIHAENTSLEKACKKLRSNGVDYENEISTLKQVVKDLGRQICYLLIHSHIRDNNDDPLALGERSKIEKILDRTGNFDDSLESDADKVVSERLLTFRDIIELRQKNQDLVTSVRQLTKKLESSEEDSNSAKAVEEAQEAIMTLDSELESVNAQLQAATRERDALRKLNNKMADGVAGTNNSVPDLELNRKIEEYESVIKKMKHESSETINKVREELKKALESNNELAIQLSVANKSIELTEMKLSTTQKSIDLAIAEKNQVKSEMEFWNKQAQKLEDQVGQKSQDLRDLQSRVEQNNTSLVTLQHEKDFANRMQLSLNNELSSLRDDKVKLNELVVNLQSMLRERDESIKEITAKFNDSTEASQNLQRKLNEREERLQILSHQSEKTFKAQNSKLEQINDLSLQLLHLKNEASEKDKRIVDLSARLKDATLNAYSKPEVKQLQDDLRTTGDRLVELTKLVNDKEASIAEKTKLLNEEKASWETKYNEIVKEMKNAEEEIAKLKEKNDVKAKELEEARGKFVADFNALQEKFAEVETKAEKFDSLDKIYEDRLNDANEKLEKEKKTVIDLQNKADVQAENNSALVEEIQSIKETVSDNNYTIAQLRKEKDVINKKLQDLEGELSVSRLELENEKNNSKTKHAELEDQNRLLLDRLELGGVSENNEDSGSNDVKQIIEYLRREKEGSDAKLATVEEENSSLRVKLESLQNEISTLQSLKNNSSVLDMNNNEKEQSQLSSQLSQINQLMENTNNLKYEIKRKDTELAHLRSEFARIKSELDNAKQNSQTQITETGINQQKLRLLEEENARLKTISSNVAPKVEESKGPPPEIIRMQEQMDKLKNKANDRIKTLKQEHAAREKEINDTKDSELKQLKEKIESLSGNQSSSGSPDGKLQQKVEELNKQLNAIKEENNGLIREKNELVKKLFTLEATFKTQFNKEKEELRKSSESSNTNGSTDATKAKYEQLQQLLEKTKSEVQQKIDEEKAKTAQEVERKFEFKMKMLTRKVEKFESESQAKKQSQASSSVKPAPQSVSQSVTQPASQAVTAATQVAAAAAQPQVRGFSKSTAFGQPVKTPQPQGAKQAQPQAFFQTQLRQASAQQPTHQSVSPQTSSSVAVSATTQPLTTTPTVQPSVQRLQPVNTSVASGKSEPTEKPKIATETKSTKPVVPVTEVSKSTPAQTATQAPVAAPSQVLAQKVPSKDTSSLPESTPSVVKSQPALQATPQTFGAQPQVTSPQLSSSTPTTQSATTTPVVKPAPKKVSVVSSIAPGKESTLAVKRPAIARTEPRNPKTPEELKSVSPSNERKRSFQDERPKVKKTRQE
ncbi:MLP1 [Candida margitis]|uniref:MLP1 n=1 Tax=Candida margitis TaxID=1775924 RepID=UPI0022276D48|nr:MLP1 [Candida margitis]KAI5970091.1 MLP1 [Candida margitis]